MSPYKRDSRDYGAGLVLAALLPLTAQAQKQHDPGTADKGIKLGNLPYSGPVPAYGIIGKAITAYYEKVNASSGMNGRRMDFITADDACKPAKSVKQTRKLVEQDEVFVPQNNPTPRSPCRCRTTTSASISTGASWTPWATRPRA